MANSPPLTRALAAPLLTVPRLTLYFVPATQIWELGEHKDNTMDFAEAIDSSDLEAFGFTDDFVIELWGAITDVKAGRVK